jgi:hypothetical protein
MEPPGRTFGAPEGELREIRGDVAMRRGGPRITLRSIRATSQ